MRPALAMVLLCSAWGAAQAGGEKAELPPELAAARAALEQNQALGESLVGGHASPKQVEDAEWLLAGGLDSARRWALQHPRDAEAHHLLGLLLCFGYRPAESVAIRTDEQTGDLVRGKTTVLRRGSQEASEEGLAEVRVAMRLARENVAYQLDYGEAMLMYGEAQTAAESLREIYEKGTGLSSGLRARVARLLARAMRTLGRARDEELWLRRLLQNDPKDEPARVRLAELVASQPPEIEWQEYEAGMARSKQDNKPVLIDFTTSWCGWGRKLEQDVFSNSNVIAQSQQFVCMKVDGDRRSDLLRRYGVTGLPTAVLLGPGGPEVHRIVGYRPAAQYLAEMRRALLQ
jgi:thioredoxin-like negative regulator of GroEL